jgi:hypothetical protein
MKTAPVLLFTYKRVESLRETIQALQQNFLALESELYIFSDGPKGDKDADQVEQVRSFIKSVSGFKKITIKEAVKNKGLANSIIDGVTEVMKFSDSVIVLEDDLFTTPNFLTFMNQALSTYKDKPKVFSISGYSLNLGNSVTLTEDAYFLNRAWSWGWATWADRWDKIDWQVADYESFKLDKQKKREFAKGGSDLNKMLQKQMDGLLDSWAIRWCYHQYNIQGLTLFPVYSKVRNNGFDEMATHTTGSAERFIPALDAGQSNHFKFPDMVVIHTYYQKKFQTKLGLIARAKYKISNLLRNILK